MMKIRVFMFALVFASLAFITWPQRAEACCSCTQTATQSMMQEWTAGTTPTIKNYVTSEFRQHRSWMVSTLWADHLLPAMMMMAEQLTVVAMQQVQIIGSFLDAKQQMETQQVLQKMQARAHKDYQPSVGMCEFGSSVKSLAASERKAEYNAIVMSARSQDRSLGSAYTSAAAGDFLDKESRVRQFRTEFCEVMDNNNGLTYMCDRDGDGNPATGDKGAVDPQVANADIDFARTVDYPWTLDIDFTNDDLKPDDATEQDVLALASNLYGHYTLPRIPGDDLRGPAPGASLTAAQKLYMDARAYEAKRSVAENSFNAITAMKSKGLAGSHDYLVALMRELGVTSDADINFILNDEPSYHAQMEILTKKIYQNPDFYTNLYDKPANVERKGVALQAISLMQKFDLFKSYLRSEASLSVLLELAVSDLQQEVENELDRTKGGGTAPVR